MPPYIIYLLGLVLRRIIGRLPLAPAVKGKVGDDPKVEEEFFGTFIPPLIVYVKH